MFDLEPPHRTPILLAALAVAVLAAMALIVLSDGRDEVHARVTAPPMRPAPADLELFAADSFWNRPLPPDAPLDPSSLVMVNALRHEVARERQADIGPWIQTTYYSTPVYVVSRRTKKRRVKLDAPPEPYTATLRTAFEKVPIPRRMRPATGTDGHVTIIQPSRDRMWEMWRARRASDGWHAAWGGAMKRVSQSPGYFTPEAWRGAQHNWGATATSLPVVGGTMLISELERGQIDHALAMALPDARAGVFAWPAQRSDGRGPPTLLPQGARLRLDPALDIDALGLPPLTRMMAEAAQRYGIVVRDRTKNAIGFFAEDPTPLGYDPYAGPDGFFGGRRPNEVLERFPWDRLQLLRMTLCSSAPCERGDSP
jgi:hypothetical protein